MLELTPIAKVFTAVFTEIVTGFDGFLFIGDPHAASGRVGRRIDDYGSAILNKLSQAARIARERKLYPVLLGDLFHKSKENNLEYLMRMMDVMRQFDVPPLLLAGSHDRFETRFTDKDAAALLASAGVLRLMDKPGKVMTLDCNGEMVHLWAAPAGSPVPRAIEADPTGRSIIVTHHDFNFCGMYPDAVELTEIEGCDLLVNGHMHTPAPMVLMGRTACHNPGSICRPSIDLKKHKPIVSVWTPAHRLSLESVELVHAPEVFDLIGREVFAATPAELKASMPKGMRLSSFAAKLRGADALEAGRTDDGSVLAEEMVGYFTLFDKPVVLQNYMTSLLRDVIEEQAA